MFYYVCNVHVCLQTRSERSDEDDDSVRSASIASARPAVSKAGPSLPKKTRNLEDAVMSFLSSRREAGPVHETTFDTTDERQAFATWFASRLHRIPDERYM